MLQSGKGNSVEEIMNNYLINLNSLYNEKRDITGEEYERRKYSNQGYKEKYHHIMHSSIKENMEGNKNESRDMKKGKKEKEREVRRRQFIENEIIDKIFSRKEQFIYEHMQNYMIEQKEECEVESNEFLFCYLFVLAMKKMFYDLCCAKIYQEVEMNEKENTNEKEEKEINSKFPEDNVEIQGEENDEINTCTNDNEEDTNIDYDLDEDILLRIGSKGSHEKNSSCGNDEQELAKIKRKKEILSKRNKCENTSKPTYDGYLSILVKTFKNNKGLLLMSLGIFSGIYLYYKMSHKIHDFLQKQYMNLSKMISSFFQQRHSDKIVFKDYGHFFKNLSKNNIKTVILNPFQNTFNYILDYKKGTETGYHASLKDPSIDNTTYSLYFDEYLLKYLLKNKLYEQIEIKVNDRVSKIPFLDMVKRNAIDIITYTFSICTFYYFYKRTVTSNSLEYSITKREDVSSLNEVILNEETRREVKSILFFLLYAKMFPSPMIYNTVLFSGKTGTGKTMLAKAIAKELNFEFLYLSSSTFVELYVGNGASKIRDLFKKAKNRKQSIVLFIDEIDSIGVTRGGTNDGTNQNQEYTQTLNQLLVEMDTLQEYNKIQLNIEQDHHRKYFGSYKYKISVESSEEMQNIQEQEKKAYEILNYYMNKEITLCDLEKIFSLQKYRREKCILFIAASNRYSSLDEALIRSKRFDKIIFFNLPNLNTRIKLITFYIHKYVNKGKETQTQILYPNLNSIKESNEVRKKDLTTTEKEEEILKKRKDTNKNDREIKKEKWANGNYKNEVVTSNSDDFNKNQIDIITVSILTNMFNCADIDYLIGSSKANAFAHARFNEYTKNRTNVEILSNLHSILYKKFCYDKQLEKIIFQKENEEVASWISQIINSTDVDFNQYIQNYISYCSDILETKIRKSNDFTYEHFAFFNEFQQMNRNGFPSKKINESSSHHDINNKSIIEYYQNLNTNYEKSTNPIDPFNSNSTKGMQVALLWISVYHMLRDMHMKYNSII